MRISPDPVRDGDQLGRDDEGDGGMHLDEVGASHLLKPQERGQGEQALRAGRMIDIPPDAERLRKTGPDLRSAGESADFKVEISLHMATEVRSEAAATTAPVGPVATRSVPQIAQDIMRQIGSGAADRDSDQIEITLKPEELGTVRLVITGGERPAVAVYADHRETLDLLRRHADILARELRDSGLEGADMSFASNTGTDQQHTAQDERSAPLMDHEPTHMQVQVEQPSRKAAGMQRAGSQIDIRI